MKVLGRQVDPRPVILAVLALLLVAAYWGVIALSEDVYLAGSSGSTFTRTGEGLAVLYQYLREIGVDARPLQQFDELPASATIVVAADEPLERPALPAEGRRLGRWVESGGRLVLIGGFARDVLREFPIGANDRAGAGREVRLGPVQPAACVTGVRSVRIGRGRILADDPAWVTHMRDTDGQVLVSRVFGEGEIVWLSSVLPCSNAGIADLDDARFATLLVAGSGGTVYFDEFHHGYARGGGAWERLGDGGRAAVVLAAAALAVLLAGVARRIGPPIEPVREREVRRGAYVSSLAGLYQRAGARTFALASLAEGLRVALAKRFGTVEAGLTRVPGAREALARAEELGASSAGIGEREFVGMARAIARIRREVEGRDG